MRTSRKLRIVAAINKCLPRFLQLIYLRWLYKKKIGRSLNLHDPKAYTEKIQWAKLHDCTPIKTKLSDKYLVREWVSERVGEEYLIPLLGVWDKYSDIDFESLPNSFVLKTNHGSGTVFVVKDKSEFDEKKCKTLFNDWMHTDYSYVFGLELQYTNIKRKILAEEYLDAKGKELQDYKFLCFDGKPYFCWVDLDRFSNHKRNIYDLDWVLQPWNQYTYGNSAIEIPKPKNFDKMVEIASVLCQGFSHVRVDLYNIEGKIYFGEMTFTNGSGYECIVPDKYDFELGKQWKITNK